MFGQRKIPAADKKPARAAVVTQERLAVKTVNWIKRATECFKQAMIVNQKLSYELDKERVIKLQELLAAVTTIEEHRALLTLAYHYNDAEAIHVLLRADQCPKEFFSILFIIKFFAKPFYYPFSSDRPDATVFSIVRKFRVQLKESFYNDVSKVLSDESFCVEQCQDDYVLAILLAAAEQFGKIDLLFGRRQALLPHACRGNFKELLYFCSNAHVFPDIDHVTLVESAHSPLAHYALSPRANKHEVRDRLVQCWPAERDSLNDVCALELLAVTYLLEDVADIQIELRCYLSKHNIRGIAKQIVMGDVMLILIDKDPGLLQSLTSEDYQFIIVNTGSSKLFHWAMQYFDQGFDQTACLVEVRHEFQRLMVMNDFRQQHIIQRFSAFFESILPHLIGMDAQCLEFILALVIQQDSVAGLMGVAQRFLIIFNNFLQQPFSADIKLNTIVFTGQTPLGVALKHGSQQVARWIYRYMTGNELKICESDRLAFAALDQGLARHGVVSSAHREDHPRILTSLYCQKLQADPLGGLDLAARQQVMTGTMSDLCSQWQKQPDKKQKGIIGDWIIRRLFFLLDGGPRQLEQEIDKITEFRQDYAEITRLQLAGYVNAVVMASTGFDGTAIIKKLLKTIKSPVDLALKQEDSLFIFTAGIFQWQCNALKLTAKQREQALFTLFLKPSIELANILKIKVDDIAKLRDYSVYGYSEPVDGFTVCLTQLEITLARDLDREQAYHYSELICQFLTTTAYEVSLYQLQTLLRLLYQLGTVLPAQINAIQMFCRQVVTSGKISPAILFDVVWDEAVFRFIEASFQKSTVDLQCLQVKTQLYRYNVRLAYQAIDQGQLPQQGPLYAVTLPYYQQRVLSRCVAVGTSGQALSVLFDDALRENNVAAAAAYIQAGYPVPDNLTVFQGCLLLFFSESLLIGKRLVENIKRRVAIYPAEINERQEGLYPLIVLVNAGREDLVNYLLDQPACVLSDVAIMRSSLHLMCALNFSDETLRKFYQKLPMNIHLEHIATLGEVCGRSALFFLAHLNPQNQALVNFFMVDDAAKLAQFSKKCILELFVLLMGWLVEETLQEYHLGLALQKQAFRFIARSKKYNYVAALREYSLNDTDFLNRFRASPEDCFDIEIQQLDTLTNVAVCLLKLSLFNKICCYLDECGFKFDLTQSYRWLDGRAFSRLLTRLKDCIHEMPPEKEIKTIVTLLKEILIRVEHLTEEVRADVVAILECPRLSPLDVMEVLDLAKLSKENIASLSCFADHKEQGSATGVELEKYATAMEDVRSISPESSVSSASSPEKTSLLQAAINTGQENSIDTALGQKKLSLIPELGEQPFLAQLCQKKFSRLLLEKCCQRMSGLVLNETTMSLSTDAGHSPLYIFYRVTKQKRCGAFLAEQAVDLLNSSDISVLELLTLVTEWLQEERFSEYHQAIGSLQSNLLRIIRKNPANYIRLLKDLAETDPAMLICLQSDVATLDFFTEDCPVDWLLAMAIAQLNLPLFQRVNDFMARQGQSLVLDQAMIWMNDNASPSRPLEKLNSMMTLHPEKVGECVMIITDLLLRAPAISIQIKRDIEAIVTIHEAVLVKECHLMKNTLLLQLLASQLNQKTPRALLEILDACDAVSLANIQSIETFSGVNGKLLNEMVSYKMDNQDSFKRALKKKLDDNKSQRAVVLVQLEKKLNTPLETSNQCVVLLDILSHSKDLLDNQKDQMAQGLEQYAEEDPYVKQLNQIAALERLIVGKRVEVVAKQKELKAQQKKADQVLQQAAAQQQLELATSEAQRACDEHWEAMARATFAAEEFQKVQQQLAQERAAMQAERDALKQERESLQALQRQLVEKEWQQERQRQEIEMLQREQEHLAVAEKQRQKESQETDEAYYRTYQQQQARLLQGDRVSHNPYTLHGRQAALGFIRAIVPMAELVREILPIPENPLPVLRIEFTHERGLFIDIGPDNCLYVLDPVGFKPGRCCVHYDDGRWIILQNQQTYEDCEVISLHPVQELHLVSGSYRILQRLNNSIECFIPDPERGFTPFTWI